MSIEISRSCQILGVEIKNDHNGNKILEYPNSDNQTLKQLCRKRLTDIHKKDPSLEKNSAELQECIQAMEQIMFIVKAGLVKVRNSSHKEEAVFNVRETFQSLLTFNEKSIVQLPGDLGHSNAKADQLPVSLETPKIDSETELLPANFEDLGKKISDRLFEGIEKPSDLSEISKKVFCADTPELAINIARAHCERDITTSVCEEGHDVCASYKYGQSYTKDTVLEVRYTVPRDVRTPGECNYDPSSHFSHESNFENRMKCLPIYMYLYDNQGNMIAKKEVCETFSYFCSEKQHDYYGIKEIQRKTTVFDLNNKEIATQVEVAPEAEVNRLATQELTLGMDCFGSTETIQGLKIENGKITRVDLKPGKNLTLNGRLRNVNQIRVVADDGTIRNVYERKGIDTTKFDPYQGFIQ